MLPVYWVPSPNEIDSYIKKKKNKGNRAWKKAMCAAKDAIPITEHIKHDEVIANTIIWSIVGMSWELAWNVIRSEGEIWYALSAHGALVDASNSAAYLNSNNSAAITYGNILFPFVGAVKSGASFLLCYQ